MSMLVQGNALQIPLADRSVQCIVTSPPYWGLRAYATGDNKHVELGSEPLHDCLGWATGNDCGECYICHMRQVARECWRVLRDDGVMFWNIADSYAGGSKDPNPNGKQGTNRGTVEFENKQFRGFVPPGLKPKDKCGIPERTALAFQADGWWWRSDIIWHKPNPMPESVTDRPTKSHEFIYVFTKAERYYWDAEAVREASIYPDDDRKGRAAIDQKRYPSGEINGVRVPAGWKTGPGSHGTIHDEGREQEVIYSGKTYPMRNLRDVWTMATQAYPGAHFATYPAELPRRCIKAATSERGACPKCGKGWERVVEHDYYQHRQRGEWEQRLQNPQGEARSPGMSKYGVATKLATTIGWRPACTCEAGGPVPCIVLDPFSGAATTGLVARELGRHYIGLELSGEYLRQSRERLSLTALDDWSAGKGNGKAADLSDLPMFRSEP